MIYKCVYCPRTFSTPYALKQHISGKHPYTSIDEDEGEASRSRTTYKEEPSLWDNDLPTEEASLWDDLPAEETGSRDDDFTMVRLQLRCITITIVSKIKLIE